MRFGLHVRLERLDREKSVERLDCLNCSSFERLDSEKKTDRAKRVGWEG